VQVAAPWTERLPGWRELFIDSPLGWVFASALLMAGVVLSGVAIALRWLGRARSALHEPTADAADYAGPSELQPAVQRMRELHTSQHRWVEEQRRFLADASHQLRTPMAVLRTQLQSAIAGDVPAAEVLPQMLHTVDRAAGLANQLLSLTKLEQLKRSGELPSLNLQAAARDAVLELAPLIAAKRLDFALEGPALSASGDPVMLGELLRNLLANAIHHAPPAGRLGMLLREDAGRIELVVWDEGPGVDDAVRPRLFQPFSAGKGGVGLGLSICKQIAEAMGASVDIYNRVADGQVVGVDAVVAWGQGP
jgi:two-component system sensor histidine kinase TctE